MKILVIEDDLLIRENIIDLLEAENFEVISAANGLLGLMLVKQQIPDIILCDIIMPEINGYDVLKALRQEQKTARIPVIFLTGKPEKSSIKESRKLGVDKYVVKPFTREELLGAIASQLEKELIPRETSGKHHKLSLGSYGDSEMSDKFDLAQLQSRFNQVLKQSPDLIIPEEQNLEDYQNKISDLVKEKELKKALAEEQFNIYYQPQIDIKTGRIISVEALLRWQHPEKGLVLPREFIEIANTTEIIIDMENWLLENACKQLEKWHKLGWENLGLSVNLSRGKFQHPHLIETIKQILENSGVKPQKLEVEVTEKILTHNVSKSIQILKKLKMLGVNIAIDDFGANCSSLLQLQQFPFTTVKIDRCLVENVQAHPINATIITAIIDIANHLNLRVVAEGTETLAELGLLKEKGCSIIQGYLFSYPVPAGELEALLHKGKTLDYNYGRT